MKKIAIIHQEMNSDCIEILKECIVKEKELRKYQIDENTMIHKLPEGIINSFLDFISGFSLRYREILLEEIKKGRLTIECWEDEDDKNENRENKSNVRERISNIMSNSNNLFEDTDFDECPF